jgi:hypothetical protein
MSADHPNGATPYSDFELDHSDALVTISFKGLFVFCLGEKIREYGECRIGVPKVEDHYLSIVIREFSGSSDLGIVKHNLSYKQNIVIESVEPVEQKVVWYAKPDFDRLGNTGDPQDFRWIIDLEGKEFHDKQLLGVGDAGGNSLLTPRISIKDGICYSRLKTVERYQRVNLQTGDVLQLGKLELVAGFDLLRSNSETGVVIRNEGGESVTLAKSVGVRYEVEISNICEPGYCEGEADFPLYYETLRDPDGVEFDITLTGNNRPRSAEPLICNMVGLGKSDDLPPPSL